MHVPPTIITPAIFRIWLRWALRKHTGVVTIILGKEIYPEGMSPEDFYKKHGPCGMYPVPYIRIYSEGKTIRVKDDKHRWNTSIVCMTKPEWTRVCEEFTPVQDFMSPDKDFVGFGMSVEMPKLSEQEIVQVENEFDAVWR